MNLPTIIVGAIVAVIFIVVLIKEIKKYRHGGGCSCDCANCPSNCSCCAEDKKKKK